MNAQAQHPYPRLAPEPGTARTDLVTEAIVNEALTLIPTHGIARAAAFLKEKNVAMDLALRVLSRPHQRRSYG